MLKDLTMPSGVRGLLSAIQENQALPPRSPLFTVIGQQWALKRPGPDNNDGYLDDDTKSAKFDNFRSR
jgi:hypothetical protein